MGSSFIAPALGIGSSLINAVNSGNANSRERSAEQQAIADQENIRNNALSDVRQTTTAIGNDSPVKLANTSTGQFVANLRQNGAGSPTGAGSSLSPALAGADPRYARGVAASQGAVQGYGNTLAGDMGRMNGAVLERQNEGIAQQGLQTNLNSLGAQSATQNYVDQLRAQAAGQQSPWAALGAGILGNVATYGSKNWGGAAPTVPTLVSNKYSPGGNSSGGSDGNVTSG